MISKKNAKECAAETVKLHVQTIEGRADIAIKQAGGVGPIRVDLTAMCTPAIEEIEKMYKSGGWDVQYVNDLARGTALILS